MQTIKDLCKTVPFEDIQKAIKYHYPEDANNYKDVYDIILKFEVVKPEEAAPKLVIRYWGTHNIFDKKALEFFEYGEGHYDVSTSDDCAISFVSWQKLVNTYISEDTLLYNSAAEIIAHFIWEITFYGNQEETQEIRKEIMNTMEKYNWGDIETVPLENLLENID